MTSFSPDDFYVAFDSSGPVGSVAVSKGTDVLARAEMTRRAEHASRLLPAIQEALEEAGLERTEVGGIVVGEGPGSFTGVRVAAATAKGLVAAWNVPLWAVSSLAATALATEAGPIRYVLLDARSDRVYGACYGVGSAGVETLVPPHPGTLRDVLAGDVPPGAIFVGEGASVHRRAIEGGGFPVGPRPGRSLADGLLSYLAHNPETPPVSDVESWEPRYVRASSVERLWTA